MPSFSKIILGANQTLMLANGHIGFIGTVDLFQILDFVI